jgi:alpha/beta superfamily hydrolase
LTSEDFELPNANGTLRGRVSGNLKSPKAVIVCLHGQPGGDLNGNTGIFNDIAATAAPLGYAVVQFSFYGAAPSDGRPEEIDLATQQLDYSSVLEYVTSRFDRPIHVAGESAGATIAALSWKPEVETYLLLWPAFDLSDTDLKPYLSPEWRSLAQAEGLIADGGIVLGADFLEQIAETDYSTCFKLPSQDVFIAHGQADPEVPYHQSLRAVPSAQGRLIFVSHPTANHGFKDPEARAYVNMYIAEWLSNH